jgi:predicted transcriptional regulator
MFVVFLNAVPVPKNDQNARKAPFSTGNENLIRYIRSICPYKQENAVSLHKVISKVRKHFNLTLDLAKIKIHQLIKDQILIVGFHDDVSINILANSTRNKIYNLIQRYPGLFTFKIKNWLHLGTNQTIWHLSFLVEFDYIREYSIKKVKIYGDHLSTPKSVILGFIILKTSPRKIISLLISNPKGMLIQEIETQLARTRTNLEYTLKKLHGFHILQKSTGSIQVYRITPQKHDQIELMLLKYLQIFG